jgi:DNA-binding TFAR19-related protein (PDSD5 family)
MRTVSIRCDQPDMIERLKLVWQLITTGRMEVQIPQEDARKILEGIRRNEIILGRDNWHLHVTPQAVNTLTSKQ